MLNEAREIVFRARLRSMSHNPDFKKTLNDRNIAPKCNYKYHGNLTHHCSIYCMVYFTVKFSGDVRFHAAILMSGCAYSHCHFHVRMRIIALPLSHCQSNLCFWFIFVFKFFLRLQYSNMPCPPGNLPDGASSCPTLIRV